MSEVKSKKYIVCADRFKKPRYDSSYTNWCDIAKVGSREQAEDLASRIMKDQDVWAVRIFEEW